MGVVKFDVHLRTSVQEDSESTPEMVNFNLGPHPVTKGDVEAMVAYLGHNKESIRDIVFVSSPKNEPTIEEEASAMLKSFFSNHENKLFDSLDLSSTVMLHTFAKWFVEAEEENETQAGSPPFSIVKDLGFLNMSFECKETKDSLHTLLTKKTDYEGLSFLDCTFHHHSSSILSDGIKMQKLKRFAFVGDYKPSGADDDDERRVFPFRSSVLWAKMLKSNTIESIDVPEFWATERTDVYLGEAVNALKENKSCLGITFDSRALSLDGDLSIRMEGYLRRNRLLNNAVKFLGGKTEANEKVLAAEFLIAGAAKPSWVPPSLNPERAAEIKKTVGATAIFELLRQPKLLYPFAKSRHKMLLWSFFQSHKKDLGSKQRTDSELKAMFEVLEDVLQKDKYCLGEKEFSISHNIADVNDPYEWAQQFHTSVVNNWNGLQRGFQTNDEFSDAKRVMHVANALKTLVEEHRQKQAVAQKRRAVGGENGGSFKKAKKMS